MKILLLGHGQAGKDTCAELLRDHAGISFRSSSEAACEIAVFPWLSGLYGYETPEECFADRRNHRQEWKDLITQYNTPDKARLCREIIATNDCYVGMRCPEEFAASRHLFGLVLWVDASKRLPPDPTMLIERDENMILIDNNHGKEDWADELFWLISTIQRLQIRVRHAA